MRANRRRWSPDRSAAVGDAAIAKAVGKIIDKGRKIAGYLLEAKPGKIESAKQLLRGGMMPREVAPNLGVSIPTLY